jgi:hypothetical protein
MFESRRFRMALLLSAAALWACSDDGGSNPPDDEGLPEFTAGESQVTADVRTEIASLVADVGASAGAAGDPEQAGVLAAIGSAFVGEGRVTGITASSALRTTPAAASMAEGTWGVFAVGVAVYPEAGQPLKAYYAAVVALKGNEAAIGIKKSESDAELRNARGDFPSAKAKGAFFQGRSRGWGAVDGYTQVIMKSLDNECTGFAVSGMACHWGIASSGLEILESVPLQFSGNGATGSREFVLPYHDMRGYSIDVYCDQVTFC